MALMSHRKEPIMMIFFIYIFSVIFIQSSSVEAVMPEYLPVNRAVSRNDAIENYFTLGFTASEILGFLLNVHGIRLSLRQLRRILKNRGCTRREQSTDMSIIVRAVEEELRGSGSIIGYRSMHQRLTTDHQLIVTRNIVRQVLKYLIQKECKHGLDTGYEDGTIVPKAQITCGI